MTLLSVDPGIRGCGVAFFEEAELIRALYVVNPSLVGSTVKECVSMAAEIAELVYTTRASVSLVVERPQIYPQGKGKGDPNLLLPLYGVTNALAGMLRGCDSLSGAAELRPREWKGNIDAGVCIWRIRERLSEKEFSRIEMPRVCCAECCKHPQEADCKKPNSCLTHNVFDAIGIGLKRLGRFEPVKVFPR